MNSSIGLTSKRILYVERKWSATHAQAEYLTVLDGLEERYKVETRFDLSEGIVDFVRNEQAEDPFDAIVTHVPNQRGNIASYDGSMQILHELRTMLDIPIVAYSGATGLGATASDDYVDGYVSKSRDAEKDLEAIIRALERAWDYLENQPCVGPPVMIEIEGRITVEAVVNSTSGLALAVSARIVKDLSDVERDVTLARTDRPDLIINCKEMMALMTLEAYEGTSVRISVEGTDAEARRVASRLYGGITSRYGCDMKFDSFVEDGE
jgi:phosphotransferase system HPr (HPr) family protein